MKIGFLIMVLFLALIPQAAIPQQANAPLGKDQVMDLVKAGMETPDLVKLIHEHGIDFDLTDDYLQALFKAGAQEAVIQALRAARPEPLTKVQVLQLVAGHVPSERAATLVKQHGIDFTPDERYLQTLQLAGADDTVIAALREASPRVISYLVVTTSPNAAVFLDEELQGQANTQGRLFIKARPGAHALKVTLKGKKDFQQSVTLAGVEATKIAARLEDAAPSLGTVRENKKDGLKYVWVPPGTFMMGCSPRDNECQDNEKPAHQVTITKGFWLGQTEVTVEMYKRFAAATGRPMPSAPNFNGGWATDNMPMVDLNWNDAQDYCTWAGGRLPTEAEWEYAARGRSTEARYDSLDEIGWYGANSGSQAHPVGEKQANGFALYDVLGNALEWVNDRYDASYDQSGRSEDPEGPTSGQQRVLRGGSWVDVSRSVRVSNRVGVDPSYWYDDVGVRCVGEVFAP